MSDRAILLKRTGLEVLSRFLMDTKVFYEEKNSGLTEEEWLVRIRDDLEIALHAEGEGMRKQVRETAEKAWECGETFGFIEGMRAGARVVLALLGEGEIRI